MSIVPLLRETKTSSNALYKARKEYDLSLAQAAVALGLSATQVERDELRDSPVTDVGNARQAFEVFCATDKSGSAGKNLLFGYMPLRVSRDIFCLSVEDIAARFGMSASQWRKMECHARAMDMEMLESIEKEIISHFEGLCS